MRQLGIDVGGTNTRAVLMAANKIIWKKEFKTPKNSRTLEKFIASLAKKSKTEKIGLGVPGVVAENKIIFCPNISYLRNFKFKIPNKKIKLDNDARCFARTEYLLGAGKGVKSILVLTIGTGVGRAYGRAGKILKIKNFEYPEKWEKEYQKISDSKNNKTLSDFLNKKISRLIKEKKPEAVIIGGGVIERKSLKFGFKFKRPKFGQYSGAIGAAMLWK